MRSFWPEKREPTEFHRRTLRWSRPMVMGVINLTPDSFSDGGKFSSIEAALAQAQHFVDAGADILDLGGESTRPGAEAVSEVEELARVVPVIERLVAAKIPCPISVDTTKARVAREALKAGAEIVNDVSGGRFDSQMLQTVAASPAIYLCGHVRGSTLAEAHGAESPNLQGIEDELRVCVEQFAALVEGQLDRVWVDPCIGFGKSLQTNLEILGSAGTIANALQCAIVVGPSRKRFIGELTGAPTEERDAGTLGACLASAEAGADVLRVHDVKSTVEALEVFQAVKDAAKVTVKNV